MRGMASTVDVSGSVRFDLRSGTVQLADDEKGVVVPAAALAALVKSAPFDARAQVGRDLGAHLGRGVVRRAGGGKSLLEADLDGVATLLAAELAVAGLGTCNLERWGRALVVHIADSPLASSPDFVAHLVEGALSAATGRALACVKLSDDGGVRVLVASEGTASRVKDWLEHGTSYADALVRLQSKGGS
jgi:hypothetical protein